jgi:hypothetical protein
LLTNVDPPLGLRGTPVAAAPGEFLSSLPELEVDGCGLVYYHDVLQVRGKPAIGKALDCK